jgi:ribosomal protein S18 acetylase RimI-like enzyme
MRMKISQVLVLPPYQRRGIASRMYEMVFSHYRLHEPKCFEVLVEDAADEFQKV